MTAEPVPAERVGRLAGLYRYPVKSLLGETLDEVAIDERGLARDRLWSVRDGDGKLGSGKSTRRFRKMDGLLMLAASYPAGGDGVPAVALPDGQRARADEPAASAAVSAHVGRPVTLGRESEVSHFDEGPVHLVTTASIGRLEHEAGTAVDVRRLRCNVLVDTGDAIGFVEDGWIGHRVQVGDAVVLEIVSPMPRCVMLDLPQRDLPAGGGLLRALTRVNDGDLGVLATVTSPGTVRRGDPVLLLH
jgi:uncharacterized protein YcbX